MDLAVVLIIIGVVVFILNIKDNEFLAGLGFVLIIMGVVFCISPPPTEFERERIRNKELKQKLWRINHPKKEDIILRHLKKENKQLEDSLK